MKQDHIRYSRNSFAYKLFLQNTRDCKSLLHIYINRTTWSRTTYTYAQYLHIPSWWWWMNEWMNEKPDRGVAFEMCVWKLWNCYSRILFARFLLSFAKFTRSGGPGISNGCQTMIVIVIAIYGSCTIRKWKIVSEGWKRTSAEFIAPPPRVEKGSLTMQR